MHDDDDLFDVDDVEAAAFRLIVSTVDGQLVVRVTGDADLATRDDLYCACVNGDQTTVVVDISAVTFMDCVGYSALAAARRVLQYHAGSLTLRNPTDAIAAPTLLG